MTRLEPGAAIGPLVIDPVSDATMKTVAALMDDPNPIHWEPVAIRALGTERAINQGPVTISHLLTLAARAAGGNDRVLRFDARFLANVFAQDKLECSGVVKSCDGAAATLELHAMVGDIQVAGATALVRTD